MDRLEMKRKKVQMKELKVEQNEQKQMNQDHHLWSDCELQKKSTQPMLHGYDIMINRNK